MLPGFGMLKDNSKKKTLFLWYSQKMRPWLSGKSSKGSLTFILNPTTLY